MAEKIGLEAVLEISDFRRGLNFYLSGIDKMNKQTGKTSQSLSSSFTSLGSSVLSLSGIVAGAGIAAVTALGGALTALGVASIKEGAAYTKEMSNVKALTGATTEEFEKLESQAESLGKTTKFTATEAAEGMSFLAMAGFEVNEIIGAMPGVLDLAAAANVDLGKSADIVSNIISGFNADVDDTGKFVDVLTKTFTSSNTSLEQLGQAMKFVAPVAASLGQSIEDTSAAMGVMGDAGIQASMAGTSLRKILLGLTAPTDRAKDLMEELGVQVFDASGAMLPFPEIVGNMNEAMEGMSDAQKAATLNTLVGKTAISGFTVLLEKGEAGLQRFGDELRNSAGTAAQIAAMQLDNLSGDVTLLQSAFSGLKIDIFKELEPVLRNLVQIGTDFLGSFGPDLVNIFAIISDSISQFSLVVGELIATFQRGGVAGLAESLGLTPQFTELVTKVVETFTQLSDTISNVLRPALDSLITGGALQAINTAIEFVNQNFEAFKGALIGIGVVLAGAAIVAGIVSIGTAIAALATPIGAIVLAAGLLGAAWQTNWFGIRDLTNQAIVQITSDFQLVANWLSIILPQAAQTARQLFVIAIVKINEAITTLNQIIFILGVAWQSTVDILTAAMTTLEQIWIISIVKINDAITTLKQIIFILSVAWSTVVSAITSATVTLEQIWTIAIIKMHDAIVTLEQIIFILRQTWENVVSAISGTIDTVLSKIESFSEALASIQLPEVLTPGSPTPFEEALNGIARAMGAPLQAAFRQFQTAAKAGFVTVSEQLTAVNDLMKELISDTLPEFSEIIEQVTTDMAEGFEASGKTINAVFASLNTVAEQVTASMAEGFGAVNTTIGALSGVLTSMDTNFSEFIKTVGKLGRELATAAGSITGEGSISEAVDTLTSKLGSLKTAADKAESAVKFGSSVKEKIDSVKSSVNSLKEALDAVKKAAESAAAAIKSIPTVTSSNSSSIAQPTPNTSMSTPSLLAAGSTSTISNITNQFFTISVGSTVAEQTTAAQLGQAIRVEVGQALSGT